jgi:membrane protein implicated in regulation of membrane protease activity
MNKNLAIMLGVIALVIGGGIINALGFQPCGTIMCVVPLALIAIMFLMSTVGKLNREDGTDVDYVRDGW